MSIQDCCPPAELAAADYSQDAALFKALADPHRLTILATLARASEEVCVCDFTAGLPLNQPAVSHHLKVARVRARYRRTARHVGVLPARFRCAATAGRRAQHCFPNEGACMKTHLNLRTADLEKSIAFYRTLLRAEPAKCYDDYALFVTEDPGLELALDLDTNARVSESAHFGVVVDSVQAVDDAIARLQDARMPVDVEREQTCCYAVQTKLWTADPDGRRWEVYTVLADTAERDDCETACCSTASG